VECHAISLVRIERPKRTSPAFADRCETIYNGADAQEFAREKEYGALRSGLNRTKQPVEEPGHLTQVNVNGPTLAESKGDPYEQA
jgi:hypothetical protein